MIENTTMDAYTAYNNELLRIIRVKRESQHPMVFKRCFALMACICAIVLLSVYAYGTSPMNEWLKSLGSVFIVADTYLRVGALGIVFFLTIYGSTLVVSVPSESRSEAIPEETLSLIAKSLVLPMSLKAAIAMQIRSEGYATFGVIYDWLDRQWTEQQLNDLRGRPGTREILKQSSPDQSC